MYKIMVCVPIIVFDYTSQAYLLLIVLHHLSIVITVMKYLIKSQFYLIDCIVLLLVKSVNIFIYFEYTHRLPHEKKSISSNPTQIWWTGIFIFFLIFVFTKFAWDSNITCIWNTMILKKFCAHQSRVVLKSHTN